MGRKMAIVCGAAAAGLAAGAAVAQEPPRGAQFPQGACSGVLCSTIGGSQAPQNQPRKSLFPEGECGGVLCGAIGGSQAPKPVGPPPACGGGLLCDVAPYAMGQPFIKPEEAARRQADAAVVSAPPPVTKVPSRHRKATARKPAAADN